jgi:hypothetical protein
MGKAYVILYFARIAVFQVPKTEGYPWMNHPGGDFHIEQKVAIPPYTPSGSAIDWET